MRVLNGGLKAWQAYGGETASGDASYPATQFAATPREGLFVDLQGMEAAGNSGACTVNALSRDLYTGSGEFNYGRPGHIPGSTHVFYDELLDGDAFLPIDALRQTLSERGLLDAERVVTYCGGGIAATVDGFALKLCGHDDVAVYDGSMSEWVQADKPLTTGDTP